ncbi:MAG: hypothetical protein ACRCZJ_07650 [Erysipelotrichaceae bacterium]
MTTWSGSIKLFLIESNLACTADGFADEAKQKGVKLSEAIPYEAFLDQYSEKHQELELVKPGICLSYDYQDVTHTKWFHAYQRFQQVSKAYDDGIFYMEVKNENPKLGIWESQFELWMDGLPKLKYSYKWEANNQTCCRCEKINWNHSFLRDPDTQGVICESCWKEVKHATDFEQYEV